MQLSVNDSSNVDRREIQNHQENPNLISLILSLDNVSVGGVPESTGEESHEKGRKVRQANLENLIKCN